MFLDEHEWKKRVDTTRMECNTLSCNAVLDQKIKVYTKTRKHPGNTRPRWRGWSRVMFSYYKKKLSYYQEKRQYSTTCERKTAVLGSIAMTNIQYSYIFFDASEIWNAVLYFCSMVATKGNVVLFFTKIRGRLPRVNDEKSSMKIKNVVFEQKRCNTTGREGQTLKCVVA